MSRGSFVAHSVLFLAVTVALPLGCTNGGTTLDGAVDASADDALDTGRPGDAAAQCLEGQSRCGTRCVDRQTDPANCGVCGHACRDGMACFMATCVSGCPLGTTSCGAACVDTATNPDHCGGCGSACPPSQLCRLRCDFGCHPVCR